MAAAQLDCRDSVFNFTAPYYVRPPVGPVAHAQSSRGRRAAQSPRPVQELAPGYNEQGTRLMVPDIHPKKSKVCGAMQGQLSCAHCHGG